MCARFDTLLVEYEKRLAMIYYFAIADCESNDRIYLMLHYRIGNNMPNAQSAGLKTKLCICQSSAFGSPSIDWDYTLLVESDNSMLCIGQNGAPGAYTMVPNCVKAF